MRIQLQKRETETRTWSEPITFRVTELTARRIREIAVEYNTDVSDVMRQLVDQLIQSREYPTTTVVAQITTEEK